MSTSSLSDEPSDELVPVNLGIYFAADLPYLVGKRRHEYKSKTISPETVTVLTMSSHVFDFNKVPGAILCTIIQFEESTEFRVHITNGTDRFHFRIVDDGSGSGTGATARKPLDIRAVTQWVLRVR